LPLQLTGTFEYSPGRTVTFPFNYVDGPVYIAPLSIFTPKFLPYPRHYVSTCYTFEHPLVPGHIYTNQIILTFSSNIPLACSMHFFSRHADPASPPFCEDWYVPADGELGPGHRFRWSHGNGFGLFPECDPFLLILNLGSPIQASLLYITE